MSSPQENKPALQMQLTKYNKFIHAIFADKLSYQMFGRPLHQVTDACIPEKGSLGFAARSKNFPSGRYSYSLPKDMHAYFDGTPVVYLIRGPYKSENNGTTGLDFFREKEVIPVLDILNAHLNKYSIYVQDRPTKTGGFLYFIWDMVKFEENNAEFRAKKAREQESQNNN